MIKFFRKIRQKLLSENKFSKYLIYAIGEIILVVIGILIALQINNRNDLGKLEDKKQLYYDQLLVDISKDTTDIRKTVNRLKKSIGTFDAYIESYSKPNLDIQTVISNLAKIDFTYPIITFNTNTITTLVQTGDIGLMPIDIRNNILDIERIQTIIENQRDQLDPEYMRLQMDARKLGFSSITNRLSNQEQLSGILNIKANWDEIILIGESAFLLKNYIEKDRINSYELLLSEYRSLESKIKIEKK